MLSDLIGQYLPNTQQEYTDNTKQETKKQTILAIDVDTMEYKNTMVIIK